MVDVNPPPILKIPDDLYKNANTRAFFQQLILIIQQLRDRSGGNTDYIDELQAINTFETTPTASIASALRNEVDSLRDELNSSKAINRAVAMQAEQLAVELQAMQANFGRLSRLFADLEECVALSMNQNNARLSALSEKIDNAEVLALCQ